MVKPRKDGWVNHNGKGPPDLPPNTMVVVRFSDGAGENWRPETVDFWSPDESDPHDYWTRDGSYNDIVAYAIRNRGAEQ